MALEWELRWIDEHVELYSSLMHAEAVKGNVSKRYRIRELEERVRELEGWKKIPLEARVTVFALLGIFFVWAPVWRFWGISWMVQELGIMVAVYGIPVLISPLVVLVLWLGWRAR